MRLQLRPGAGAFAGPLALAALIACTGETPIAEPPEVDRAAFEAEVYPVLLRDCAFPACHGNPARFFRIYGPGRTRLDRRSGTYAPPTGAELDAAFDRARSMLSGAPDPARSLLVRKPLEASAGGAAHMGTDALGRNVYASTEDPGWRAIARWAGVRLDDAGDVGVGDAGREDAGGDGGVAEDDAATDDARDAGGDA
jgi:hypothetical protein